MIGRAGLRINRESGRRCIAGRNFFRALDRREAYDCLPPAFIEQLKIVFGQIANRFSMLVAHDNRHNHQVNLALKRRDGLIAGCDRLLRKRQDAATN